MTENEKNTSYSGIILTDSHYAKGELVDLDFQLRYIVLKGRDAVSYLSPVDGFVHIIMAEGCWSGTYRLDDNSYMIGSGENTIHPVQKNSLFEWKNAAEDTVATLLFVPQATLSALIARHGYDPVQLKNRPISKNNQRLSLVVSRLCELSARQGLLNTLRLQILLMEILLHQVEDIYTENEQETANGNKNYYDKVLLVKKIIENDLSKNHTISELAKEVGTNEQYIKKYFKQYFGKTVMSYATSTKMEHAKKLIMTGEYRISDVARMIGYKHSTHFTTAFKKYFGFIPNALRGFVHVTIPSIAVNFVSQDWMLL